MGYTAALTVKTKSSHGTIMIHWKQNAVTLPKFSSLAALEVVNFWCSQWWKFCQNVDISFSVQDKIILIALHKTAVSPLLMHWRYCSLTLSHQYVIIIPSCRTGVSAVSNMPVLFGGEFTVWIIYVVKCKTAVSRTPEHTRQAPGVWDRFIPA